MNQEELNKEFTIACSEQNLDKIKNLSQEYPFTTEKRSFFEKIFKSAKPMLNVHNDKSSGYLELCKRGSVDCLEYIVNHLSFLYQPHQIKGVYVPETLRSISLGLSRAVEDKHFNCIDVLMPFAKKYSGIDLSIYFLFTNACRDGDISIINALVNNKFIEPKINYYQNTKYDEFHPANEGFVNACESVHLDIVEYLTKSTDLKEKVYVI
ncbi:hypothetical protein GW796_07715 [archaeon]|nr:hypothetical protein [archaeon]